MFKMVFHGKNKNALKGILRHIFAVFMCDFFVNFDFAKGEK